MDKQKIIEFLSEIIAQFDYLERQPKWIRETYQDELNIWCEKIINSLKKGN